ncbi:hypothetical protein GCM10009111_21900 [Colwellia asteriadis]|uniref:Carrier domain-containing protein n=1 Tax=Colwellia asteriadis TaxID=517723 RepID=A0ABN1L8Q9_9GAMM
MLVKQTIINFIQEKTHSNDIDLEMSLFASIKSFDFMMLMLDLEQKFNIALPLEEAFELNTHNICQFITWVEKYAN